MAVYATYYHEYWNVLQQLWQEENACKNNTNMISRQWIVSRSSVIHRWFIWNVMYKMGPEQTQTKERLDHFLRKVLCFGQIQHTYHKIKGFKSDLTRINIFSRHTKTHAFHTSLIPYLTTLLKVFKNKKISVIPGTLIKRCFFPSLKWSSTFLTFHLTSIWSNLITLTGKILGWFFLYIFLIIITIIIYLFPVFLLILPLNCLSSISSLQVYKWEGIIFSHKIQSSALLVLLPWWDLRNFSLGCSVLQYLMIVVLS